MLPIELGAAAAFEAYRVWQSNTALSEPLSADRAAQREALIGLAVAEGGYLLHVLCDMTRDVDGEFVLASRLWGSTGRNLESYGRKETAVYAASTAALIFAQVAIPPYFTPLEQLSPP